jgi:hypothetical protein
MLPPLYDEFFIINPDFITNLNHGVLAHGSGPSPNLGQEAFLYWDQSFVNRGVSLNHVL